MRVTTSTDNVVSGNLVGEKITMSLDAQATAHLIGQLTRLYKDPEEACVREYSTNALDSHIEAGVTRPIEVSLPSPLSNYLKIRDFGVGLSVQDLHEIYSKYGRSTKRDSDDVQGCLGFGCKSALAYTSQFTLTAVKDGIKTTVAISKNAQGVGEMTVVDTASTFDPNGVEVAIPAKSYNEMARKAARLFSFWPKGSVLVDGKEPASIHDSEDVLKVNGDLLVVRGAGTSYVVMGHVAYPAEIAHGMGYNNSLVAFVGMGEVAFTPSRESLEDCSLTRDRLAQIGVDFTAAVPGVIQRAVDQATTPMEALQTIARFEKILPKGASSPRYKFKGRDVPMEFNQEVVYIDGSPSKLSAHSRYKQIAMPSWCEDAVWVTGYDAETFTAGQRKKIDFYFEEKNVYFRRALLTNAKPPKAWIDPDSIYPWEEIKAVKLPRNHRGVSGRIPGSYDCLVYDGTSDIDGQPQIKWESEKLADEIDDTEEVYYYNKTSTYSTIHDLAKILAADGEPFTLVSMIETRVNKFLRFFPDAENAYQAAVKRFDSWAAKIKKADLSALSIQFSGYSYYRHQIHKPDYTKLDPARCDDPAIRAAIKVATRDVSKLRSEWNAFEDALGKTPDRAEKLDPMASYPLWDSGQLASDPDHLYAYLNWAYARNQASA